VTSLRCTRRVWAAVLLALGFAAASPSAAAPAGGSVVSGGVSVQLEVTPRGRQGEPREGEAATIRLRIADRATGTPLGGLAPRAWIVPAGPASDCRARLGALLDGSPLPPSGVDLGAFLVLVLNDDATVSAVDPRFAEGAATPLATIPLAGVGEDWALAEDLGRLFVSLPGADRIAVLDTAALKSLRDLPAGPRPGRMALQPDGRYLWVIHAGAPPERAPGVTVIDPRCLRTVAELPAGRGGHDLAFSDDGRYAFLTGEEEGTVAVFDTGRLARLRAVPAGARPVAVAWSAAARAAYVVDAAGAITVLDPERPKPRAKIPVGPGAGPLRFVPGGRFGILLYPGTKRLDVLDSAVDRVVQTVDLPDESDRVAWSGALAYLSLRHGANLLALPLAALGSGALPLLEVPAGENPPGTREAAVAGGAAGIVPVPGGGAVLLANPADRAVYLYAEGLAAPVGHFAHDRQPRAVLPLDRSLREVRPGIYETAIRLDRAGRFELALVLDSPPVATCFPLEIAAAPARGRSPRAAPEPPRPAFAIAATEPPELTAGREARVLLRRGDPGVRPGASAPGRGEIAVLLSLSPGTWQSAATLREVAGGLYELRFQPPEAGLYLLFPEPSGSGASSPLALRVLPSPGGPP
jgi:cytochrome d1-like heme-containing protein